MVLAKMDDGTWDYVKIEGLVVDDCIEDEIILCRQALSSSID